MKRVFSTTKKPPMIQEYIKQYNAYRQKFTNKCPFIILIQLGKFLETYNESARVLNEV